MAPPVAPSSVADREAAYTHLTAALEAPGLAVVQLEALRRFLAVVPVTGAALVLRGVTTTSDWDLLAERHVAEGALDAVPGVDYFATPADALRYWNGTAWVQGGPTVNQHWVAAVDSLDRARMVADA